MPNHDFPTHYGHTFSTLEEQIAFLQSLQESGVQPADIIILTPPPKK
ncbi:MAG TPA: hypothetical protein VFU76_07820 [Terriglobales bacterium]|nr:hypothetical protein [Terriglobales bacterium]